MLSSEQKIMMAYGVMKLTLKEIIGYEKNYMDHQICDAISIARKALAAVEELEENK